MRNYLKIISLWLILNILTGITMDLALFLQTTQGMKDASIYKKILSAEFWASVQWLFAIPANRIGNVFLNPAQLGLSSYIFDFLAQILSNKYWLKLTTSIDDYAGMVIIFLGMVVSKMRVFG
jgi:uncharacterized protein (DUF486 family)